jgi:hypothetical protein
MLILPKKTITRHQAERFANRLIRRNNSECRKNQSVKDEFEEARGRFYTHV